jgi:hypothetical protein
LSDQQAALEEVARLRARSRDGRIIILVAENPKRRTARARFALYAPGMLVSAYIPAVGNPKLALADLRWEVKKKFIRIEYS